MVKILTKLRVSNQFDKTVISAVLKLTNGKKVQSSEILGLEGIVLK